MGPLLFGHSTPAIYNQYYYYIVCLQFRIYVIIYAVLLYTPPTTFYVSELCPTTL
jgi:hypothetical protein